MASQTVEQRLHDAVVGILTDAAMTLSGSPVAVWRELPEPFRQDQVPMVVVEWPVEEDRIPWASDLYQTDYILDIVFVVPRPARSDGSRIARQRLGIIRQQIQKALESAPSLRLAGLACMRSAWSITIQEQDLAFGGSNLAMQASRLFVSLMVEGDAELPPPPPPPPVVQGSLTAPFTVPAAA